MNTTSLFRIATPTAPRIGRVAPRQPTAALAAPQHSDEREQLVHAARRCALRLARVESRLRWRWLKRVLFG